jgi:imidazolonepropionase-like amidohydrolase
MRGTGHWTAIVLSWVLSSALPSAAQDQVTAIRGARIYTISGGVIDAGVVLFQNGRILDVGPGLPIPPGARIIEANGRIVTPGLIDARCSLGVSSTDAWETSGALVPQVRILDSFAMPRDPDWLREGVTAVYVSPGPENVIGGIGAVVKLAGSLREAVVREAAGVSASLGEVPKRSFGDRAPRTRMGAVFLLRDALLRAQDYDQRTAARDPAGRDLGLEALARVIRRELPLRVQANTPDDIMNAVRVGKEFNLRLVIDVGAGAHLVAAELAAAGVPVVVGPSIVGAGDGGRYEFAAHTEENAARLRRAGVHIALSTDDDGGRSVVMEAAVAKAHGLPEDEALKAITLSAAEILGVADRLGSIERGKDADLVIWDRHPLNTWAKAQQVIVGGRVVFERAEARGGAR